MVSYDQLTKPEQDLVDRICDDWEAALGDEIAPNIDQFLARVTTTEARHVLLVDLLMKQNELHWRRKRERGMEMTRPNGGSSRSADSWKFASDFLEAARHRHIELQRYPESFARLIVDEFTLAQELNDRPTVSDDVKRFPDVGCLESQLRACLHDEWPTRLRLIEPPQDFKMPLSRPVHLGRQRRDDPSPICTVKGDDGNLRLIVAPASETRVARNHVSVEVVSRYRISIANISRKSEVPVDNSVKLMPGGQVVRPCPCEFQMVDFIFRAEVI